MSIRLIKGSEHWILVSYWSGKEKKAKGMFFFLRASWRGGKTFWRSSVFGSFLVQFPQSPQKGETLCIIKLVMKNSNSVAQIIWINQFPNLFNLFILLPSNQSVNNSKASTSNNNKPARKVSSHGQMDLQWINKSCEQRVLGKFN